VSNHLARLSMAALDGQSRDGSGRDRVTVLSTEAGGRSTPLRLDHSQAMYYPANPYERLQPGATFTIREGAKVVGYGKALRRTDDSAI
jgi:hypothetical protein